VRFAFPEDCYSGEPNRKSARLSKIGITLSPDVQKLLAEARHEAESRQFSRMPFVAT
jgi:hypothetical protein